MATRKITPSTEPQRRCIGSATFGIEPHQAALADFPLQPSRKDGIGLLCKPHWTLYTRSLRQAARARATLDATATEQEPAVGPAVPPREARIKRAPKPAAVDPALTAARALVDQVDALPADEYVKRVGDDDVQTALAVIASGNGHHAPEPAVTEEADAA